MIAVLFWSILPTKMLNKPIDPQIYLYVASNCPLGSAFSSFLSSRKIEFKLVRCLSQRLQDVRAICPIAVYGLTPLLVHSARAIEDWRAVYRYVDEHLSNNRLGQLKPQEIVFFFDQLESANAALSSVDFDNESRIKTAKEIMIAANQSSECSSNATLRSLVEEWIECLNRINIKDVL